MEYAILTTSILASLSTYHQVYRVKTNKSSKDISFPHIISVFLNMITHLVYSTQINNKMLTFTFGNGVSATFILIIISLYYRNRRHINEPIELVEQNI
jgi:uncharacterized protein with PQ loop repeat